MDSTAELVHTLEQIGLTEKEARVYLALLSLESATAYRIAEHCEVKKPTVYVILEDLRKKGLVLKVPHAKKALFAARDISEYLHEQETKIKSVRSIIPQLNALGIAHKPSVFFFTGLRGMAEALNHKFDFMRGKTYHSFYSNLAGADQRQINAYEAWDRKAAEAGISFQIIMQEESRRNQKNLVELSHNHSGIDIRFLKDYIYPSHISLVIGEDFMTIEDSKNLYATIIDDKQTADAMRQIFQIVWEKGV